MEVTLVLPGDPAELSPNVRLHPYVRRDKARKWKAWAFHAWDQAGRPRLNPPVEVLFLVRRGRATDADALPASLALKAALDALTDRHCPYEKSGLLLEDDGPKFVRRIEIAQETGAAWKGREEVVMTVREIDG